jgi:hypothetical protein
MSPTRVQRPTISLLIAALLLAALLPLISPWVMAGSAGPGWADICSASGQPRAAAVPGEEGQGPLAGGTMDCPACLPHAPALGLPPPVATPALLAGLLRFSAPERFFSAPRTAHAWAPALARAPPRFA